MRQSYFGNIRISEAFFKAPQYLYLFQKWLRHTIWANTAFIRDWLNPYYIQAKPHLNTRYAYAFYVFLVWITLIDQYTVVQRISLIFQNRKIEKKIELKSLEVESNRKQIYELKTNTTTLEKFAREHYYMHRPGEEVFILKE